MSPFLRVILLIIIFFFLYRLLRKFLTNLFGQNNRQNVSSSTRHKRKYDNIEEAKFTEIQDDDDKEKNA